MLVIVLILGFWFVWTMGGLEMVEKFSALRKKHHYSYEIVGVGGVMTPKDYQEYRKNGADLVQSATGAMWNADLAYDIWKVNQ